MKKFLSFLSSRQFLAIVALVVVSLVIWFVGPLLAFGGLKPLAAIGIRILVIVLLLAGVALWLGGQSVVVVPVAFLCLLIWYASPLLSFGDLQPMSPVSVRLFAIALVLAVFIGICLYGLLKRMRDDKSFRERVLAFGEQKAASPADGRLTKVGEIVSGAVSRLKAMRTGARGASRLFQGKRYLYELPWYITLGSPSSGKTSVLLQSGLSFPIAEQMGRVARSLVERTRHVDWWLSNRAVLIDTAGYYTRHGTSDLPLPSGTLRSANASDTDKNAAPAVADHQEPPSEPAGAASIVADAETARATIDRAEWEGFLGLLRRYRPRAPINGALVTVDLDSLVSRDETIRLAEAASLRARLTELREVLGIRFPVYLVITKMDRLTGFAEYFGSLPEESRAQVWGFTLPSGSEVVARDGLRAYCREQLRMLTERLVDGIDTRLHDEHGAAQRRKLSAFGEEFAALGDALGTLIERVFLDSRYDTTQAHASLRGVYFTSAAQQGDEVVAERRTVVQRLAESLGRSPYRVATARSGRESYFLRELIEKVVLPESQLVRPNLRWAFRERLLRFVGHALALLAFAWLAIGMWTSFANNGAYLDAIAGKTRALSSKVAGLYKAPKLDGVPDTLDDAQQLAGYRGLDLSAPGGAFRYGLYAAPDIVAESRGTYDALEDHLLLPQIVRRIETVLSAAIVSQDSKAAYDALRAYLMLYDRAKFDAADVKAWVLDDWARTDSAAVFGGRASMIEHVQRLFSGARIVQSPLIRNDALIQRARAFLDGSNATQRLYERAKIAMEKEAPDELTLLRVVGPQAGLVFSRASGAPLSRGVPGLFTYDGYRTLFDKRLQEFVQLARGDDAWVMGRAYLGEAQKKTAEFVRDAARLDDPLTDAIRREYLGEYVRHWDAFLGDIRIVNGTSLAFNLQVLRRIAAPDSPLTRLARAAVRETTLTTQAAPGDAGAMQKAAAQFGQNAEEALGIRAEERVEREIVDSHFAALREVVTGSADKSVAVRTDATAGPSGLDNVMGLLNEYYTALTVADNALGNNSMPPENDAASRLKMTANTMPAPYRAVLLDLATQGSRDVNRGIGQLLSRQMQAVVGDACRMAVEGNYPFSPDSKRDIGIEDFTRVFAQGGVIDDFFSKTLAPFVDTAANPWRYKTLPGATEPVQGPDLEPFQHAKAIRGVFFSADGQKQMAWTANVSVPELDPTITSLSLDVDGQTMLYQHGPVAPFIVKWPGERGGVLAEIAASPRIRADTATISASGPWALMRLVQKGRVSATATPGRTRVSFDFDGRRAALDFAMAGSIPNPLTSDVLKTFRCPSAIPVFNLADSGPPPGLPPGLPSASGAAAVLVRGR
ncbi:type VI secretion protein VasK [Burkholderia stagnalis]|uniref:type VI secretion system membrane subunit TssM n=1 Tax=Burkholderia stagnalis TaxID=1503054 RepID=UPI00075CBE1E|nr:type VI secretion system membrane subunit TssM [Burkholderia stagnalis]AOK55665.1 type VI secretion protein VasK [Burkholderia stagnalis]KVN84588.1 type VI secretion protein VasK [Burkholderia stagnalis]KWO29714.1 type VI secretion protein VasK [Burkholderia stagnalis]KWO33285.1 type VI secretion protein VasK [Burkholderia stagnalis]